MHRVSPPLFLTTAILYGIFVQTAAVVAQSPYEAESLALEAMLRPWHDPYAHPLWGRPVPLVAPPNAAMHTEYSWGVTMNEMRPIYHQFSRRFPGTVIGGGSGLPYPPRNPARTRQMGTYYIRAPW